MALWLVRAGKHGEYESRFLQENRIYLTWDGLNEDLSKVDSKKSLLNLLQEHYPDSKMNTLRNWAGQIWPFPNEMKKADWVVLPSRLKPAAIHLAEIVGPYAFDSKADDPYYHFHKVKWIATNIPRSSFDQDLLYSFGAFMTVCRIARNDAEHRVRAMAKSGWKSMSTKPKKAAGDGEPVAADLGLLARDQIAKLISRKFKGHALAGLVDAILRAQGYSTFVSPEGKDKGVDILAAPGLLGFGAPRICVQVKSGDAPVDTPTLNQLIGSMQNVQADQGLLVSWGGFKSSVDKEVPTHFFQVRLWDQDDLVDALLANYDKMGEDLRADIPLKRIWTVAEVDEEV